MTQTTTVATQAADNIREAREVIKRLGGRRADLADRLHGNMLTNVTLVLRHGEGDDLSLALDELRASKARAALRTVERVGRALDDIGAGERIRTAEWAAAADTLASEAYERDLDRRLADDPTLADRMAGLLPGTVDPLAGMRGPDGELGLDTEPEAYLAQRDADAERVEEA